MSFPVRSPAASFPRTRLFAPRPATVAQATARLAVGVALAAAAACGQAAFADPPAGEVLQFSFENSRIFPGTFRDYWVYVPRQYDGTTPACVHVNQDGIQFDAPKVFDRLIDEKKMPVTIGVFVMHGRVRAARPDALDRFNRSYEYDGLGGDYARFLLDELLPDVEKRTTSDGRKIVLSRAGNDRAIAGTSSGAIAAFTAAWERPDAFTRVFSGIGTYVGLRGGHGYATLVRKSEPKPIRIFLQGGSGDLNIYGGDWWIANQALERSLSFAGYDVRHEWGDGGHNGKHATELFPAAVEWLWRDWPQPVARGAGSSQLQDIVAAGGSGWERATGLAGFAATVDPTGRPALFHRETKTVDGVGRAETTWAEIGLPGCTPRDGGPLVATPPGMVSSAQIWRPDGTLVVAHEPAPAPDGRRQATLVVCEPGRARPLAQLPPGRVGALAVRADGSLYATLAGTGPDTPSRVVFIPAAGEAPRVVATLPAPAVATGVCLSPDQNLLYVADGASHWVHSFVVAADGTLADGQKYFHLHVPDTRDDAGADGLAVDRDGRLWVATAMGLQVCDQAGRVNVILPLPDGARPTSVAFGGPEFDSVVVTTDTGAFARRLKVRGAPGCLPPSLPAKPRL
ncbi:MAG: SMP-30/gluconolactonase/LRE family protein [Planctomycetota bacterium]